MIEPSEADLDYFSKVERKKNILKFLENGDWKRLQDNPNQPWIFQPQTLWPYISTLNILNPNFEPRTSDDKFMFRIVQ